MRQKQLVLRKYPIQLIIIEIYVALGYLAHKVLLYKLLWYYLCCNRQIRKYKHNFTCCSNSFYSQDTHVCCINTLHKRKSCCGSTPIQCCNGIVGLINSTHCCGKTPQQWDMLQWKGECTSLDTNAFSNFSNWICRVTLQASFWLE